ncbi:MAG: SH3 domain-containing protein [Candidatus Cloacimonadia bacterium]
MNKTIVCLLVILATLLTISSLEAAANKSELFDKGVEAYEGRQFEEALEYFLQLSDDGAISPELYHNIGNTYYRLNKIGMAILYYKMGLKLKPSDVSLQSNVEFLLTQTVDKQSVEELNPFLKFTKRMIDALSLNMLLVISLIFFIVSVLIINLTLIIYPNEDRTIPYLFLTFTLILTALFGGTSIHRLKNLNDDTEAVLIASSANGYSGPAEDYTNLFRIHEGMVFTVVKTDNDWSQIMLPTGISGWVKNDLFLRVKVRSK